MNGKSKAQISLQDVEMWEQLWMVEDSVLPTLQKTTWIDCERTKAGRVSYV